MMNSLLGVIIMEAHKDQLLQLYRQFISMHSSIVCFTSISLFSSTALFIAYMHMLPLPTTQKLSADLN